MQVLRIASITALVLYSPYGYTHMWKFALERFKLEELTLYSIESWQKSTTATILDSEGYLHTVKPGDYVGPNQDGFVSVACILKDKIYLQRIYEAPNPASNDSGWQSAYLAWSVNGRPVPFAHRLPAACAARRVSRNK